MWPADYFAPRYFASRYWERLAPAPVVGGATGDMHPILPIIVNVPTFTRMGTLCSQLSDSDARLCYVV
jgi:hypothetical protein